MMEGGKAFLEFDFWLVARGLFLLLIFGYLLFALVVLRQVQVMNQVLKTTLSGWLKILGVVHFFFALTVFFWALFFV